MADTSFDFGGITEGFRINVTQNSHGFSVGQALYLAGSTYTLAKADAQSTSDVLGLIVTITDANNFVLQTQGRITGLSGLTAGEGHFLSAVSAGALTTTEPSTAGQVSKPVLVADSTTTGFLVNFRGITVTAGSTGGSAFSFVSSVAISSDATIDITGLETGFDYIFALQNVLPATDSVRLEMRTSTDGGSTFDAGASDYADARGAAQTAIQVSRDDVGNVAGEGVSINITVHNPRDTVQTHVSSIGLSAVAGGSGIGTSNAGKRNSAADVDAVRFLLTSGNLASGTIRLYKRKLS